MKNAAGGTKSFNVGLGLLKIWLCYEVVLTHLAEYAVPEVPVLAKLRDYAVPAFMLMTFFFSARSFAACEGAWVRKRFYRLLLPYVFWSVFSCAVFMVLSAWYPSLSVPWEMLGWQLAGGTTRQIGSQMWFLAVLIWLTALFAVFFRFTPRKYVDHGLVLIFSLSAMVEYSGLNRWLFEGLRYELCNPLGRICSMIPYACLGLFIGLRRDMLSRMSVATRWVAVATAIAWAVFLYHYKVFNVPPGFFYRGFGMLAMGLAFCAAAYCLPAEKLPARAVSAVAYLSRFSMGVYFTHILVGRVFLEVAGAHFGIAGKCFDAANVTFVLSFGVSMLIGALPWKTARGLVE